MVVHQNITNLAGYFHFLNVRKIPYVIRQTRPPQKGEAPAARSIRGLHVFNAGIGLLSHT